MDIEENQIKTKEIGSQNMNDMYMSTYIKNEHLIINQINQTKSISNYLLIDNTIQDNRSSINDKHTKTDDVIENDESNTYEKYIKIDIKKLKILQNMYVILLSKITF